MMMLAWISRTSHPGALLPHFKFAIRYGAQYDLVKEYEGAEQVGV